MGINKTINGNNHEETKTTDKEILTDNLLSFYGDKADDHVNGKLFFNPTLGLLDNNKLVAAIANFIHEDPFSFYRLIIGTDSQSRFNNGNSEIDFVTAIIIYRKGKGARYFWRKERQYRKPILRDKIYTETLMSLDTARKLVPEVRKSISPGKYDFEIHIDVGPLGKTREMIREVVGMVTGSGYVAKTKPDSWGASHVADKHT